MRFEDIRRYLKPYSIVANRTTTISHAFAASIAPSDAFDAEAVRLALVSLGQNPDTDLRCVYCSGEAETWDHVYATVKNKMFSGYGHRLGNLVPCCKLCNSRKGNKEWRVFLGTVRTTASERLERECRIDAYLKAYSVIDRIPDHLPEYHQLQAIRLQVLELLAEADKLATVVRGKTKEIEARTIKIDGPGVGRG